MSCNRAPETMENEMTEDKKPKKKPSAVSRAKKAAKEFAGDPDRAARKEALDRKYQDQPVMVGFHHVTKSYKLFKNDKQRLAYNRLVYNVKKVLPIAKEVRKIIIETGEYLETLPNKKAKDAHMKLVEKGIKEEYTPRMKKLTYAQGKLCIKLVYRECSSSSYQLIQAFLGPVKAGFYQAFAWAFGASLTKKYDPNGVDRLTERVVRQVESGQI